MKTLKYTGILVAVIAVLGFIGAVGGFDSKTAFANPFYVGTKAKTALATTSVAYLTTAIATSTYIYDSYEQNGTNQTNGGNITLPDSVAVLLQGSASSTLTTVSVSCEFGDDTAPNGVIDWYQNDVLGATTTNPGVQNISGINSFTFTFASSTMGGAASNATNQTRYQKAVLCPVPTRYVRAVISVTGGNASVWSVIVPKKQRN